MCPRPRLPLRAEDRVPALDAVLRANVTVTVREVELTRRSMQCGVVSQDGFEPGCCG